MHNPYLRTKLNFTKLLILVPAFRVIQIEIRLLPQVLTYDSLVGPEVVSITTQVLAELGC